MSAFYCVADKRLRNEIENKGLVVGNGQGYFLLPDAPEIDEDQFDLWTVVVPEVADTGLPQMVRYPVAPQAMVRLEPQAGLAAKF